MKRLNDYPNALLLEKTGDISVLKFTALEQTGIVGHCFSTRFGGVSEGIYSSMNFKEDGDDPEANVRENYIRIAGTMGFDPEKAVRPTLVHGTVVRKVRPEDLGNGVTRPSKLDGIDSLITNEPGVALVATFADCVPLYFVDTTHKAIGLAHSGWKGTVGKIALSVIDAMKFEYGTAPEDLTVAIGPCICGDCYEVSADLNEAFLPGFSGDIESVTGISYREQIMRPGKTEGKFLLDLRMANLQTFLSAGIDRSHIHIADVCTCCNPDLLFSHRATHGRRGACAAFLTIR